MRFQSCLLTEPAGSALGRVPVWPQWTPAQFLKRAIDIAGGAALLLFGLPWLLLTAARVFKRSPGAVFQKATFVGLHCEPFQARLFRNPEDAPIARGAEFLPLIIHLLTGEMSLVGPPLARFSETVTRQNWRRLRQFSMKPGLTGPWLLERQAGRQSNYAQDWSLKKDAVILFRTIPVVLAAIRGER